LDCIASTNDTIIISTEIEDEYQGRYRPTIIPYISYRAELEKKCKINSVGVNRIESRYKRHRRKIVLPKHNKDHKWVKTAISEQARYIISEDGHMSIPPFRTNGNNCVVITPADYIKEHCSD